MVERTANEVDRVDDARADVRQEKSEARRVRWAHPLGSRDDVHGKIRGKRTFDGIADCRGSNAPMPDQTADRRGDTPDLDLLARALALGMPRRRLVRVAFALVTGVGWRGVGGGARRARADDAPRLVVVAPPSNGPKLGNIRVEQVTSASAMIAWTTNEPADSVVEYGPTSELGQAASDPTLVTDHRVALTDLAAATTYHYRVRSRNANGTHTTHNDRTFVTSGGEVIAFVGPDGNIWVTRPDGTDQRELTSFAFAQYASCGPPSWSPDGTTLAFTGPDGIYLYRAGVLAPLANVQGCAAPSFTPDGRRLMFGCARNVQFGDIQSIEELSDTPSWGFVSSSNLDGSDWHVVVPYAVNDYPDWNQPGHRVQADDIDVSSADGWLLIDASASMSEIDLASPDGTGIQRLSIVGQGRFSKDGRGIVIGQCEGNCYHNRGPFTVTYRWIDRDGNPAGDLYALTQNVLGGRPSLSSDEQSLAFSAFDANPGSNISIFDSTVYVVDVSTGNSVAVAQGRDPAWQPAGGSFE
jgi:hypothetical protein